MNRSDNHIEKVPVGWDVKRFDGLLDYIQPTPYIVESTAYDDSYKTPVLTPGKSFIKGYTNESTGIFNSLPVIIFDDFTTANKFVNFPFKVKSSAMKILKPKDENVNIKYVFYYMQTVRVSYDTHKRYWISVFSKLPVPYPPKATQEAIVSKIEELFSEIEKGIESLSTAKQQLKTYRQSVLKWAFEGKLTNGLNYDSNDLHEDYDLTIAAEDEVDYKTEKNHRNQNNHINHSSDKGELPKGWKRVKLGSVCSLITDGKHGDCDNEENSGFYFLSAKDVRNNTLLWENARQITKAGFEETHRRTNLKPGDICLVNTGATIGRISIAPNDDKTYKSTFQKSVAVIKCIPELIDNKYCKYLLQGDLKKLVKVSSGTAVPNLLLGSLKGHLINLPSSREDQNKIVQEIESRLSVADKMEESINQSLQRAEALKQSILKKAFEGRLVKTEK